MIEIVKGLIDKGYAYERDGSVYFEVNKFPEYGKLSKRDKEDMMAGARVEVDERKKILWTLRSGRRQKKASLLGKPVGKGKARMAHRVHCNVNETSC